MTDTAGQEEYRGLFATSNLSSDAFLLVYDITSAASLQTLAHYTSMIEMEEEAREERGYGKGRRSRGDVMGREMGVRAVKVVVGNKVDLKGMREVSAREGLEWARGRGCGFMETSAREMVNIEETFARGSRLSALLSFLPPLLIPPQHFLFSPQDISLVKMLLFRLCIPVPFLGR